MTTLRTFIENMVDPELLLESGFPRIMRIMSGLVPSVKTFAIITWENPKGKKESDEYNKKKNRELEDLLKSGSYGYVKIKGKYGNFENPFFIMNITEKDAIELGKPGMDKSGWQDSILFGTVNEPEDITFRLIYMDGRPDQVRHVWVKEDEGKKDYFSEYKGRKFRIPFYDDEHETSKFTHGTSGTEITGKVKKESFEFAVGDNVFYEKDFEKTLIDKVNNDFDFYDVINESCTGKHRWLGRGYVHSLLHNAARKNYK